MQVLQDLCLFAWISLVQAWWGSLIVGALFRRIELPRSCQVWLSLVIANAFASALIFALGILHYVTARVLLSLLTVATLPVAWSIVRRWHNYVAQFKSNPPTLSATALLFVVVLVATVGLSAALAPEVRGDAIIYHISEALLFSVNHGHVEIPGSVLTYIPQYQQLLYAAALTIGTDTLARLLHWWAGLLLLLGTYSVARLLDLSRTGALAAMALLSLFPIWTYLATSCYVDLATANYTLAAIAMLLLAMRFGRSNPCQLYQLLIVSGAMLGFAMGTKYTAIVNAAAPTGIALLYVMKHLKLSLRHSVTALLLFTVSSLLFFAPWLLRNYMWTGNPIAPSMMHILGPSSVPDSTLNWGDIKAGDPQLLRSPIALLAAYPAMVAAFSDYGNYLPLLGVVLGLLAFALARAKKRSAGTPPVRMLLLFLFVALLLGVPTMAVRRDSRYVMAHMGIVAVLVVLWAQQVFSYLQLPRRRIVTICTICFVSTGIFYAIRTAASFRDLNENLLPPLSNATRNEYQRRRLKNYDANVALSTAQLSADKKVYGADYPARVHYIMMGASITSDLQVPPVESLTANDLKKLQHQNVDYIFGEVDPALLTNLRLISHYAGKPLYQIL